MYYTSILPTVLWVVCFSPTAQKHTLTTRVNGKMLHLPPWELGQIMPQKGPQILLVNCLTGRAWQNLHRNPQTSSLVFWNHKMLQTFFFKFWFWEWLHKISPRPNSTKLLFLCSRSTKCSKSSSSSSSSSNSGFGHDYKKSLSNPIPPDFCLCVPESENAPNLLLLLSHPSCWNLSRVLRVFG